MQEIVTHLAFKDRAEEAVRFYTSVVPGSRITGMTWFRAGEPGPEGAVRTIRFELLGQKFLAVNGGPEFSFAEGTSLLVRCDTQEEIDSLYSRLIADGGEESQCGWVTDRYGLSWQIVPAILQDLMVEGDADRIDRMMQALLKMKKLDIAELRAAYETSPAK